MSSAPIVDRIRIIPRPDEFLDRNVGSSGELFFSRDSNSLRVYSGRDRGGFEVARSDLNNVTNAVFAAKAAAAGISGGGGQSGASISVSAIAPSSPASGNLWLNTNNGYLYVYINDGSSSQWMQPAVPTQPIPALATVATTGDFNDLINKPQFADGFSGSYNDLTNKPNIPDDISDLTDTTNLLFSGSYDDLTDKPTTFASLSLSDTTLTGTTTLQQTTEVLNTKTGATGTVEHDYSTGAVFYHSGLVANFTANFTNVPTTNDRTISIALILAQGATPRIPTAVQINGAAQTIRWQGASQPTGTANRTEVVSFTLIRTGAAWTVIGSLTSYGG